MATYPKGFSSTPENPGKSKFMLYLRDVVLPYDGDNCLIWPFAREPTGYASTVRNRKKIYIHRYICELAHGAPPSPKHHAAHSCNNGPGGCVNPRHISWKTNAENQLDRFRSQTKGYRFKLLPHQAEEIRNLRGIEPVQVTAERFGISVTHAKNIQTGRAVRTFRFFSDAEVNAIRTARRTLKQLAAEYGSSISAISRVRCGHAYGHVPGQRGEKA